MTMPEVAPPRHSMHARFYNPNLGRFLSVDPVGGEVGSSQSWNRYAYVMNNPVALVDPDGSTVWSALDTVGWYKNEIFAASARTNGQVTPLEIARVVFQENMNDFNWIKGDDTTGSFSIAYLQGIGGPEAKNFAAKVANHLGGNRSLGIGEMKLGTAARLLGYSTWNPIHRAQLIKKLEDPATAIMLIAMELQYIKNERPGISGSLLCSQYNTGLSDSNSTTEVGRRSERHLGLIMRRLGLPTMQQKSTVQRVNQHVVRVDGKLKFVAPR